MGFNQSSSQSTARSGDLFGDVLSGCLAGLGIWAKPSPRVLAKAISKPSTQSNVYPMVKPLRVIRVKDANPQMAGRMVISGRMADVCAELDRMAA